MIKDSSNLLRVLNTTTIFSIFSTTTLLFICFFLNYFDQHNVNVVFCNYCDKYVFLHHQKSCPIYQKYFFRRKKSLNGCFWKPIRSWSGPNRFHIYVHIQTAFHPAIHTKQNPIFFISPLKWLKFFTTHNASIKGPLV